MAMLAIIVGGPVPFLALIVGVSLAATAMLGYVVYKINFAPIKDGESDAVRAALVGVRVRVRGGLTQTLSLTRCERPGCAARRISYTSAARPGRPVPGPSPSPSWGCEP